MSSSAVILPDLLMLITNIMKLDVSLNFAAPGGL